jgi:hypothetical protein
MRANSGYIQCLRAEAGRRLPADFARRVVQNAELQERSARRARLTALTGALCAAVAVSLVLAARDAAAQANLQRWKQAHRQLIAIEDTL